MVLFTINTKTKNSRRNSIVKNRLVTIIIIKT